MTQGERIYQVRTLAKMSQEKFGKKIGITGASVSTIESGKNNAGNQTIKLICQEFGVNETWLRTGEGPMSIDREKEISAFMGDIMKGEPDFRRALVHILARMTPDEWKILEAKARELLAEMETPPSE